MISQHPTQLSFEHSQEANKAWLAEFDRLKAENERLKKKVEDLERELASIELGGAPWRVRK